MALDWQWASDYLSHGRKKYIRPLYDRGLYIWKENKWDPDSNIHVGWTYSGITQRFVTYHKNSTTTIQALSPYPNSSYSPLRSYSTRFTIVRYAGLHSLIQKDFKFYIIESDPTQTPPKIQGCRKCKQSGLIDKWCGVTTCWNVNHREDGTPYCEKHPDLVISQLSPYHRWHYISCEHGVQDGHTIPKGQECHYCNGTGKRDYGSKLERTLWDGSPLRIKDGKIIKSSASLLERMIADYVEPIG
jgi:hypothetical protein